jgi:hypothetical protein
MRTGYQGVLRSDDLDAPEGWAPAQITVVEPVRVWNGTDYLDPRSQGLCFEPMYQLQLITIQVTDPGGVIVQTRQVVKDGGCADP